MPRRSMVSRWQLHDRVATVAASVASPPDDVPWRAGCPAATESSLCSAKWLETSRVKIPAIVIEAHIWVGQQVLNVGRRLLCSSSWKPATTSATCTPVLSMYILHLHGPAARAQHAHERVAQHRVAQMADVGGLVGIDVGVLDDDLAGDRLAGLFAGAMQHGVSHKRRGPAAR